MQEGIEVSILGQVFTLASDEGEEHVRRVAAEVERRMRELSDRGRPAFATAVTVALNIASEYQKLQDENQKVNDGIDRLTARLAASLLAGRGDGEEKE